VWSPEREGSPGISKSFGEFFKAFKIQLAFYAIKESHAHMIVGERIDPKSSFKPVYTA